LLRKNRLNGRHKGQGAARKNNGCGWTAVREPNLAEKSCLHWKEKEMEKEIQDVFLGRLTYDESLDWYEGTAGDGVTIYIYTDEDSRPDPALAYARQVLADLPGLDRRARQIAADALLENKNETWLEEDEPPVSEDEFQVRLTLESITFYPDETAEVFYADGDLFWGHTILLNLEGNTLTGAHLAG